MMVAVENGEPVAVGSHQPVDVDGTEVSEVVGVATLPRLRGRGLGAGITSALVAHATETADMVFLAAGDDDVARVYERVGFARLATSAVAERATGPAEAPSLLLVGRHQGGAAQRVEEEVEAQDGGRRVRVDVEGLGVDGVDDDEVAVRAVAGRGSRADVPGEPAVVAQLDCAVRAAAGRPCRPAPLGSSVTEAGMFATAQCQKPLAVGASGS